MSDIDSSLESFDVVSLPKWLSNHLYVSLRRVSSSRSKSRGRLVNASLRSPMAFVSTEATKPEIKIPFDYSFVEACMTRLTTLLLK